MVFVVELTKDNLLIECGVTMEANFNEYLSLLGLVNFGFFFRCPVYIARVDIKYKLAVVYRTLGVKSFRNNII